jgi:hypothetical protein
VPEHLGRLRVALSVLGRSTRKPDQLVVYLSEADALSKTELKGATELVQRSGGELHTHPSRLSPGAARVPSKQLCTSEVIAYQDADDFTHDRRLEILGEAFRDASAMHVFHDMVRVRRFTFGWVAKQKASQALAPYETIDGSFLFDRYFPTKELKRPEGVWVFGEDIEIGFGLGVFAIRREVLDRVQWRAQEDLRLIPEDFTNAPFKPWWQGEGRTPHGFEDSEFCFESLFHFNQMRFITAPLYFYCNDLRWRDEQIYRARSNFGRILGRD